MIYLDCAATTQPYQQALAKFYNVSSLTWMNPSSRLYSTDAANVLFDSRQTIADIVGCKPEQILFTSGSTEAANWIIRSSVGRGDHIITTLIEHPCVYNTAWDSGAYVHFVQTDSDGKVDLISLTRLLEYCTEREGKILVAIMGANNELGTIEPVQEIGDLVHCFRRARYFCDTTQLWPHEKISTDGIDYACMSAHKFGGLKGTGFMYCKDPASLQPLLTGGAQEFGMRAGTENVGGIAAMAEALELTERYKADFKEAATAIRKQIVSQSEYRVNGGHDVIQNIVSLTMPDCDAQQMVAALGMDEIYIAAGSACSTGEAEPSRILRAVGMSDEEALRTIRISFDAKIREGDINTLFYKLKYYREVLCDNRSNQGDD